ncbi:hypothetical protein PIN31115_02081 [Pandoraea iniqua]|uniref:Uncharacterized protein n=1 Tax=Pandoraea iniqua TaxID=2508288 RepID=A0A5E4UKR1_9BURK|nr:carbohydrate porin [Pandoraea iniqua]VVE00547.1 hypothetical protein PIN31115_02081 [Pandoraea iniqua]
MTAEERIAQLEARLAMAESRIAILERMGRQYAIHHLPHPLPNYPVQPAWPPPGQFPPGTITC